MSEQRENELLELLDTAKDDPDAWPVIVDEVHALVADNQALRRQVRSLRSMLITLVPDIQAVWKAAREQIMSVWAMVGPYLEPDAPMGTDWDDKVAAGYERDAEPRPRLGEHGTCCALVGSPDDPAVCGYEIVYTKPADDQSGVLAWTHVDPRINTTHRARLGGPA